MTSDEHRQAVAIARFTVIAPLVTRTLAPPAYAAARKAILAMSHPFPGADEGRRVADRSLARWVQIYRAAAPHGTVAAFAALSPKGRSDRGVPRVFTEAEIVEAIRLRHELATRSTANLIAHLENHTLKEATLAYHLRQRGATKKAIASSGRAFPRYEAQAPNATWQSDVKDGLWLPDPAHPDRRREVHLMGFIDDHSRLVTHGEWYFKESLPCLFDCFKKAIFKYGVPAKVYWDNGPIYRAKQTRLVAARLGTRVLFSTPYHSEGRGKVERFWQTVAGGFIQEAEHADLQTLAQLNQFFWAWLEGYNLRVHGSTKKPPLDRWRAGTEPIRRPHPVDLAEAFLWEEKRLVKKTGTLSLAGNEYATDESLVGKTVDVRYDPLDLATVRVYRDGAFVGIAAPATLATHTHRKATPKPDDAKYLPLPSSKRLLAARAADRQAAIATDLAALAPDTPVTPPPAPGRGLLEEALGRTLLEAEAEIAARFFERYAPRNDHDLREVLATVVERRGRDRHLAFYLEELGTAWKGGRA